ncbi:hypothetical protein [Streptomyces sp. URMC 129]|uniref:hypothetical protein n=1 Tax=Streptomyces sp. URMC 129 TaxID=3423407 RepID=UPI003F1BBBA5
MRIRVSRSFSAGAAAVAACGALLIAAPLGNAAAPTELSYTATGSTHLAGLEADVPLGPGPTEVELDLDTGNLTADISLPESTTEFNLFGFLPTHAKVKIDQVGELSGTYQDGIVNVSGEFSVRITEVGHFGFGIPMPDCETTAPVAITLTSDDSFLPAEGGTLTGTYHLPEFADCGVDTAIINALVVGPEHSISIDLAGAA